ncbi:helix-turn-helix domain-containing protein [Francisella philomiragia]|uniref:helix-turn-helix domain-containing protein n=1 Tax=Francisella philomiragia TaxID=28110 RepID=UPI001908214F|nr:helix-turn-helix domain-containing protein [Francisella philomiragia]
MIQLKFDFKEMPKKRIGRPSEISEELVFAVIDDIKKQSKNKKLTNKKIIEKHNISERTFYRIKAGDKKYQQQFESAVQKESKEFSLALSE